MQLSFIVATLAGGIALALAILLFGELYRIIPNRTELGPRTVAVDYRPVRLDSAGFAPLRLAGAWRLSSEDRRFGGLSGLETAGGDLLALTDSGVVARFPKPSGRPAAAARIAELPDGPGDRRFKRRRDSEALFRDPGGRGWWIGFEFAIQAWLFDEDFGAVRRRLSLPRKLWPKTGFEAAAFDGRNLLMFPESGGTLLVVTPAGKLSFRPVAAGPVAEARTLPGGNLLLVERAVTAAGFRNRLVEIRGGSGGYRLVRRYPLGVAFHDNVEGMAVEERPGGALRLWLVTDDNFEWPMRSLLIALDVPARLRS